MATKLLFFYLVLTYLTSVSQQDILISEFNADNPNIDMAEYVELWNPTPCQQSLAGYTLVFFSGHQKPAVVYRKVNLSSHCINGNDYFLLGPSSLSPIPDLSLGVTDNADMIENGGEKPDSVALYKNGHIPDSPSSQDLVDAVIYGIASHSTIEPFAPDLMDKQPAIREDESYYRDGDESMSRCSLDALSLTSFFIGVLTPGTMNFCKPSHAAGPCVSEQLYNDETYQPPRDFKFKYFKNSIAQGSPLHSLNVRSSIECATECSKRKTCSRFNYFKKGINIYNCALFPPCGWRINPNDNCMVGQKI